jgi:ureidoglycolate lyase
MDISQQAFAPYGAFIPPMEDGTAFGPQDAALQLGAGIPRFYTMRLPNHGLMIGRITRHRKVTQVLGSAGGLPWLLAVAAPPPEDLPGAEPPLQDIRAFRIPDDAAACSIPATGRATASAAAASKRRSRRRSATRSSSAQSRCSI